MIRKIVIISDLHMGINGSKTCGFKQDDCGFVAYLEYLVSERNVDVIILNGDIFELWEPGQHTLNLGNHGPPMSKKLFMQIAESWPCTCDFIVNCPNVILVNGNHDACIRTKKFLDKCYADVLIPDFGLYVAHGHQSDIWCSDDSVLLGVTKFATRMYGHYELIKHDMDSDLVALEHTIQSATTRTCDTKAMIHAEAVAAALQCKIVVYGHTHKPLIVCMNDMVYCNTGNCCTSKCTIDQINMELRDAPLTMEDDNGQQPNIPATMDACAAGIPCNTCDGSVMLVPPTAGSGDMNAACVRRYVRIEHVKANVTSKEMKRVSLVKIDL